jgi:hypothetical protein
MKTLILAAALLTGGAAIAQTGTQTPPADTQAGTQTSQPGNQNVARDARGIPVVSNPAQVPPGANESAPIPPGAVFQPNPNQAAVFTPRPSAGNYPACSRTVTDNCMQTYERGRTPN